MTNAELFSRAVSYATRRSLEVNEAMRLGYGNDGAIWLTNMQTAIKAFARIDNYRIELECYQRLRDATVTSIRGFEVPQLIDFDDELAVIEMSVVKPPFLLDFGKVHLDKRPDFPAESLQEWRDEMKELWESRWPEVRLLLAALERFGIYYLDAKPGNIMFAPSP
jgi:hypothetical protein